MIENRAIREESNELRRFIEYRPGSALPVPALGGSSRAAFTDESAEKGVELKFN